MNEPAALTTPLTDEVVLMLRAGDRVLLNGTLYTARDAAHQRMITALDNGAPPPFPIKGQVIYYVGPTPAPPGRPIGSAGPTTSYRMDAFAPRLIGLGLKGMIGKGARNAAVRKALVENGAVYFGAVGGAAALLAQCITACEVVAYEDLGPEAIRRLTVKDFPVLVIDDCAGNDQYEIVRRERNIPRIKRTWLINGMEQTVQVPPMRRLLDVLRQDLGMKGTKEGCGEGECGACTVLLDGRPMLACLIPAGQIPDGTTLMTVEGLEQTQKGRLLQMVYQQKGAVQCGFCIPGMLMSSYAFLESGQEPTYEAIREAHAGNICRCTGYVKIIEAVQTAAQQWPKP